MGKLEPIERHSTNWEGLWYHREINAFTSAVIDLADLRKFKGKVRLYVRKNRFYNGGENGRPNYHFCLKDASSDIFRMLTVEEDEEDEEDGRWEMGDKICCQKGLGLVYHKRRSPRDSTNSTARGVLLLVMGRE